MITIAVIWFGIGEPSKIFLIIYTTVFIVILNTAAGVGAISASKIRAAQALGASSRQIFFLVALPATVPYILTGMRIAMKQSVHHDRRCRAGAPRMPASASCCGEGGCTSRSATSSSRSVSLCILGFTADRLFRFGVARFAGRYDVTP